MCFTGGVESKPWQSRVACDSWQCRTVAHSARAKRGFAWRRRTVRRTTVICRQISSDSWMWLSSDGQKKSNTARLLRCQLPPIISLQIDLMATMQNEDQSRKHLLRLYLAWVTFSYHRPWWTAAVIYETCQLIKLFDNSFPAFYGSMAWLLVCQKITRKKTRFCSILLK